MDIRLYGRKRRARRPPYLFYCLHHQICLQVRIEQEEFSCCAFVFRSKITTAVHPPLPHSLSHHHDAANPLVPNDKSSRSRSDPKDAWPSSIQSLSFSQSATIGESRVVVPGSGHHHDHDMASVPCLLDLLLHNVGCLKTCIVFGSWLLPQRQPPRRTDRPSSSLPHASMVVRSE